MLRRPSVEQLAECLGLRADLRGEAVRDLIDSQTLFQAKVAAQQLEGALSKRLKPIKQKLVELIALLEAGIDFAEDDIAVAADATHARRIAKLLGETTGRAPLVVLHTEANAARKLADFRGSRFERHPNDLKGNFDVLALTRPDVLRSIHDAYFDAGADIAETNTFGATRIVLSEYGLQETAFEMNVAAARA